jgi:toxin ParE1/3/4
MTLTVWWSPEAKADLDRIDDYFAGRDPIHADQVTMLAIAAAQFLAQNPEAGPILQRTRQRKWRVAKTRYILVYRPDGDILRINRVFHAARDWQRFL